MLPKSECHVGHPSRNLSADNYRMLYEFHRSQNGRKPGSIHATYLLCGTRKFEAPSITNGNGNIKNGDGDVPMSDISFLSSSMPGQDVETEMETIPVTTVILAKEEDLEGGFVDYLLIISRTRALMSSSCERLFRGAGVNTYL